MQHDSKLIEYFSSFTDLSAAYISELEKQISVKIIKKDTLYFDKDSYSNQLGFLAKGIIRIFDIDSSGQEWNKVILSPPSLLLGNPNFLLKSTHYVQSISSCEIIELPISFMKYTLKKYPEMNEIRTQILLHLFEKKSEREYDFLTLSAKERYLKFIKTNGHIIDQLPQFHIASYLGITATQLSRINVSLRNQQM